MCTCLPSTVSAVLLVAQNVDARRIGIRAISDRARELVGWACAALPVDAGLAQGTLVLASTVARSRTHPSVTCAAVRRMRIEVRTDGVVVIAAPGRPGPACTLSIHTRQTTWALT